MGTFLLVAGIVLVFLAGSVMAMRPSPRQRQQARLRQRARSAGLRLHLQPGTALVDYVLPWRMQELDVVRELGFRAARSGGEGWRVELRRGPSENALAAILEELPAGVGLVTLDAQGLAARWDERGGEGEVDRIAAVLGKLREACTARR